MPINDELLITNYIKQYGVTSEDLISAAKYHLEKMRSNLFVISLCKFAKENNMGSADIDSLLYLARKGSNLFDKSDIHLENIKKYPEKKLFKQMYYDEKIIENVMTSSILKNYSVQKYMEEIINLENRDTLETLKIYTSLAAWAIKNNEYNFADSLVRYIDNSISLNHEYSEKIKLKDYLNTSARVNLYFNRDMNFFRDFKALVDYYPEDKINIQILNKMYLVLNEKRGMANQNK